MEQKPVAARDIGTVVSSLADEAAAVASAVAPILGVMVEHTRKEVEDATAIEWEELPPAVVQYYLAVKDVLTRERYTLTLNTANWFADPSYQKIDVIPKRAGGIFEDPPIVASFIVSKETHLLASRDEIIAALESHYRPKPVDFEDNQLHGLEVRICKNMIEMPDRLGIEAINKFQRAMQGKRLRLRRNVAHDYDSYGGEAMVLYQPQNPAELKEFQSPMNHIQFSLQQEHIEALSHLDETLRWFFMRHLVRVLSDYIAATQ